MANLTNFGEGEYLDYAFNGVALAAPGTWLALFTAGPADDGTGTEVTGGSYARIQVNPNGAVAGPRWTAKALDGSGDYFIANSDILTFPTATAGWGVVVGVGVFDALSGGTMRQYAALATSQNVSVGNTFKFAVGDLRFTAK